MDWNTILPFLVVGAAMFFMMRHGGGCCGGGHGGHDSRSGGDAHAGHGGCCGGLGAEGRGAHDASDRRQNAQTITIGVEGMTCNHCVQTVEKALRAVPGVYSAEVSLEKKQAVVAFDPALTDAGALKDAVRNAGYQVN